MEERHVTIQNAAQFVRELIELGNVYKIDNTDYITSVIDGSVITVEVDGKNKPIMLWSEKAKLGDHVLLNIFGETINTTVERNWFYTFIGMLPGHIIKNMMMTIINAALSTEEKNTYKTMEVVAPFVTEIDEKTKSEFSLLTVRDIATIVFHKPSKTAQLQTKLFDEEFRKAIGKKVRVKSWSLFENMFKTLMNIESVEQMYSTFKYSATILGMKQTDAMVHVLIKFAENIDAFQKVFSGKEFNLAALATGLQDMELFFGIMRVFTSGGGARQEAKPAPSPFNTTTRAGEVRTIGSAPATVQLGSYGGAVVVPLPNVLNNNVLSQQIRLPDVVRNMSLSMPQQTMPQPMNFGYACNQSPAVPVLGKVITLDNSPQMRTQGPKFRQILENGKVV